MRLQRVLYAIDEANKKDKRKEILNGASWPKEYLYSSRSSKILEKYWPNSDELLQIAIRGHHIERWHIPRDEYPMDRKGYLQWRTKLKLHHSKVLGEIMKTYDYSNDEIKVVQQMVMKTKLKTDPATQTLEDVICLVFLTHYLEDFIFKHSREKVISIIQKTWAKMSEKGHQFALTIDFSTSAGDIVKQALS